MTVFRHDTTPHPDPAWVDDDPPALRGADWLGAVMLGLAPQAFSLLAFLCGGVLLATSAFPAVGERIETLTRVAPLLVIELSHFLGSVIGLLLLVVAAGLWRRLEGAYAAALMLLGVGVVFTLLRGLDYEEAGLLAAVGVGLWTVRPAFTRRSRLLRAPLTAPWFLGIAATLAAVAALGLFAYREVAYSDELWWTFLRNGDASRFLRAGVGVATAAALIAAWQWLAPPRDAFRGRPTPETLARAASILKRAEVARPDGWLALSGDKDFLFSPTGESFLAFRIRGRRWIAMGEPVGRAEERTRLLWRFVEQADAAGALPVFYALRAESLAPVAEMGLVLRKVGETALVPLDRFSLEGKARQNLRTTRNRLEREGCAFRVAAAGEAPLADMQAVSDAWLAQQGGTEKEFSMGRFDPTYLASTPTALLTRGDALIAFANLWISGDKREFAVDLMRHSADAPPGAMDYLFLKLIEWGKAEGFAALDLGMAPLSGLEPRRLAPAMTRLGAAVFAEGERVYGFRGLRAYKAKFDPVWRSMFIAAPPSVMMPLALLDVALLTSGGWAGLLGLKPAGARNGPIGRARGGSQAAPNPAPAPPAKS